LVFLLLKGITLGLIAGAIPGPILTATFTQVLNQGLNKAMKLVWWSLMAEVAAASSIMILLSFVKLEPVYFQLISFAGSIIIFKMALDVWKIKSVSTSGGLTLTLKDIFSITFANGLLWTFWITVCLPFALSLEPQIPYGRFVFILLFEIGWLISTAGFAVLCSILKSSIERSAALPCVFKAFGIMLFYFSVDMFISASKALYTIFNFL
jgi:threonine/homoserine/homoserine lactone efflux protein